MVLQYFELGLGCVTELGGRKTKMRWPSKEEKKSETGINHEHYSY